MPNVFRNYTAQSVGTSSTTVYTAPASTQATAIGMTVANRTASNIRVSVALYDGTADTYIVGGPTPASTGATLAVGGALVVVGGEQKLVLEPGDQLKVISDTANSADVVVSVLEVS